MSHPTARSLTSLESPPRETGPSVRFAKNEQPLLTDRHVSPQTNSSYLAQLNAKLVASGAAKHSLRLDGLSDRQREDVLACFYNLLSQREEDRNQLESLSTAHKVITYDHERLCGQHKALKIRVVVAEREKEVARAGVSGLALKLKNEQEMHKLAKAESQKARTALNFVRTQAQTDARRRDAQLERTMQNWQKLSTDNARMLASNWHTGVLVLNSIDQVVQAPRTDSFWDPSINDLNRTIESLQEECEAFRHVTLTTANQLASLLAYVDGEQEPERLSSSAFFTQTASSSSSASSMSRSVMGTSQAQVQVSSSTSHPNNAHGRLADMLSKLRARAEVEMSSAGRLGQSLHGLRASTVAGSVFEDDLELERAGRIRSGLEERINELERELAESRNMVDEGQRVLAELAASPSAVESEESAQVDEESKRAEKRTSDAMEALRVQLEEDRQHNLLMAVKLGQERAAFESERARFAEEKRRRNLEELLAEPAVTPPAPIVTPATPTSASTSLSPRSRHLLSSRSHPSVPSPLRMRSDSITEHAVHRTPPVVVARRRSRKGPATPLARLVTHKLVAEKIASVKAQRIAKAEAQTTRRDDAASQSDENVSEWLTTTQSMEDEGSQALQPSSKANRQREQIPVGGSAMSTVKATRTLHSSVSTTTATSTTNRPPRTGGLMASTAASMGRSQSKALPTNGSVPSMTTSQPRPANLFKASGVGPEAAARKRSGR